MFQRMQQKFDHIYHKYVSINSSNTLYKLINVGMRSHPASLGLRRFSSRQDSGQKTLIGQGHDYRETGSLGSYKEGNRAGGHVPLWRGDI
jgi:hypothetical protein